MFDSDLRLPIDNLCGVASVRSLHIGHFVGHWAKFSRNESMIDCYLLLSLQVVCALMTAELLKLVRIDHKEQCPRGKDFCLWICLRAWKTKKKLEFQLVLWSSSSHLFLARGYFSLVLVNPLRVISIKFILVISMLCKTEWSWELQTWSHKMNLLDILSTSPHYFFRKWIGPFYKWEFKIWS